MGGAGTLTVPKELDFATFYIDDVLLGIDIRQIQEINRNLSLTTVPHAPEAVRGVINLRGEVVTVIELRSVLGMGSKPISSLTRNIIVQRGQERIGIVVDRIADVVTVHRDNIDDAPANLRGLDGRFFSGVYKLQKHLLLLLNVEDVLA